MEGGLGSLKSLTMERLKVTLTTLIVNSNKTAQLVEQLPPELGAAEPACGSERRIFVGVLSDVAGQTRVATRSSRRNKVGKWVAMLRVATSSLNALQMPASVTVVCNDSVGLRAMKRAA